jgi:hypothetical protein
VSRTLLIAVVACLAALTGATGASAKRASFNVTVTGTQTTRADGSDRCHDSSGSDVTESGRLLERTTFTTQRAGRVVFRTARHGSVRMRQSSKILGSGTLSRTSTLDTHGISPGACAEVDPAAGCGSTPFAGWRLSLSGGGGKVVGIGVASNGAPGGNPFRLCQNPFDGYPGLVRARPARLTKKAIFSRKKTIRAVGKLTKRREYADGYTLAKGTVVNGLSFTAVLTRR